MDATVMTISTLYAPRLLDTVAVEWETADVTNGNAFRGTGREIILAKNDGDESATITLESVADPFGREADLTDTIAAGATVALMPGVEGWRQSDGRILVSANSDDVSIAVIRLPTN